MDINTSSAETPHQAPQLEWKPLVLTNEKLDALWEKVRTFPQVFDDTSKGNKEMFVARLLDPKNIFVEIGEGLGLAAGFNVRPHIDMAVHLIMFDRRLRGRELMFLGILGYFFERLKLRRVTSVITEDSPMTIRLALRLGFKHEGTMREAVLRDGKYLNAHIYGMLREELSYEIATNGSGAQEKVSREVADASG